MTKTHFNLPAIRIAQKLPMAFLASALLVGCGVGIASYLIGSQTVSELTERQLNTISQERAARVQDFLETLRDDLASVAVSDATATALRDLGIGWNQLDDPTATLQEAFIETNPHEAGERYLLDGAQSFRQNYNFAHTRFHPGFRSQMLSRNFSDMYLFDAEGNMSYSVAKRDDFATNFSEDGGPFADTALARAYREAAELEAGEVVIADIAANPARDGAHSAFLAVPVFDQRGTRLGVLGPRFRCPGSTSR